MDIGSPRRVIRGRGPNVIGARVRAYPGAVPTPLFCLRPPVPILPVEGAAPMHLFTFPLLGIALQGDFRLTGGRSQLAGVCGPPFGRQPGLRVDACLSCRWCPLSSSEFAGPRWGQLVHYAVEEVVPLAASAPPRYPTARAGFAAALSAFTSLHQRFHFAPAEPGHPPQGRGWRHRNAIDEFHQRDKRRLLPYHGSCLRSVSSLQPQ